REGGLLLPLNSSAQLVSVVSNGRRTVANAQADTPGSEGIARSVRSRDVVLIRSRRQDRSNEIARTRLRSRDRSSLSEHDRITDRIVTTREGERGQETIVVQLGRTISPDKANVNRSTSLADDLTDRLHVRDLGVLRQPDNVRE